MSASAHVRSHPLLRSMHAALQLQQAQQQQQQQQSITCTHNCDGGEKHEVKDGETGTACTRCRLLAQSSRSVAEPASSSLSTPPTDELMQLHRASLELLSPFAALSPNLSQLALCVREPSQALQSQSRAAEESTGGTIQPASGIPDAHSVDNLRLDDYVDPEGFLRWDAFNSLAAPPSSSSSSFATSSSASSSSSSTSSSSATSAATSVLDSAGAASPTSPAAEVHFAASSRRLLGVCGLLDRYVTSLTLDQFRAKYGGVAMQSNHASMMDALFELFKLRRTDDADEQATTAASPTAPTSPSLGSDSALHRGHTAGLVLMLLSTHTERVLGDIFCARRVSGSVVCPRMLRDLLTAPEVRQALHPMALWMLQALVGSPRSLNLRNILWHGFVPLACPETNEQIQRFTSALWMVHLSILKQCEKVWIPASSVAATVTASTTETGSASSVPTPAVVPALPFRRPLKFKFPGDAALRSHISSSLFTHSSPPPTDVAASSSSFSSSPDVSMFEHWPIPPSAVWGCSASSFASLTSRLECLMSRSYFLPHHRLHDFMYAWRLLRSNPFLALAVLLPLVEQTVRHWFVYANAEVQSSNSGAATNPEKVSASSFANSSPQPSSHPNPHIESGLLFAQSERLFTTIDIVLGERIMPLDDPASFSLDAVSASPSPPPPVTSMQKCDRASAFAFPLVAHPCPYPAVSSCAELNVLYRRSELSPWLPTLPGCSLMQALSELFISRLGPRLRDRVAHGEILWGPGTVTPQGDIIANQDHPTLQPWIVLYAVNILVALACKFPICTSVLSESDTAASQPILEVPAVFASPLARAASVFMEGYVPITHARAQTMQKLIRVLEGTAMLQGHLDAHDQAVEKDRVDGGEGSTSAPAGQEEEEFLSLRAPVREWYALSQSDSRSPEFLQARLDVLVAECASHKDAGLEALSLFANRLALHAGLLLSDLHTQEPNMPLWDLMPAWLLNHRSNQRSALKDARWWTLAADSFWTRSHKAFHHSTTVESASSSSSTCSVSCVLHCHDRCMSHAPIFCLERMLDTLVTMHSAFDGTYTALQHAASAPAAPSAKRRLAEHVAEEALPAVLTCSALTIAAIAILWEHMLTKAHPAAVTENEVGAHALDASSASSSVLLSSPPLPSSSSLLLRRDRSISRLLKKVSSALDRLRTLYAQNRWLPAMHEWAIVLQAVQGWMDAHCK